MQTKCACGRMLSEDRMFDLGSRQYMCAICWRKSMIKEYMKIIMSRFDNIKKLAGEIKALQEAERK